MTTLPHPKRTKRRVVEVDYDDKAGHWCIVIPVAGGRREAINLGRAIGKFLAPAELKPRRKDGRWAVSGRETYKNDPPTSEG